MLKLKQDFYLQLASVGLGLKVKLKRQKGDSKGLS